MKKRKPSEQAKFERWYCDAFGLTRKELRDLRAENGYETPTLDFAWMGWRARAESKAVESRQ